VSGKLPDHHRRRRGRRRRPAVAAIRQSTYRGSLPLATRDLRIVLSPLSDTAGLAGAAFIVVDELLSPEHLGLWIDNGSPAGRAKLIHANLDQSRA
jgi:hypothetical protein